MLSGTIDHIKSTSLSERIRELENKGYSENLVARHDYFLCHNGKIKLYPQDFCVDEIIRFDTATDPDDQAILYAISSDNKNVKGLYVDSYGLYHDDLSKEMLQRIRNCESANRKNNTPEESFWKEQL